MKIKYCILWIDDEELKDERERIERYLKDLGFIPEIDKRDSYSPQDNFDFHKYNLILLDYQLNDSKTTDIILDKIQQKDYYSEIIFYSGRQKFEDHIKKNIGRFEGVFWCDDRGQKLYQKIINVINLTLKKFQDLNNLRGLIMAETSDLDRTKKDIFSGYFKLNHCDQEKVKRIILDKIEDSLLSNYKRIKKYQGKKLEKIEEIELSEKFDKTIFDLIEEVIFDMDKKGRCITEIINAINSKIVFNYQDYKDNILTKRDYLAHSQEREQGNRLFYGPFEFTEDECKNIRKKIAEYKDVLNSILDEINKAKK